MLSHSATEARSNFFQMIKETITLHEPHRITSPAGSVVLLSEEDYDAMQETLYLLSQKEWRQEFAESVAEADRGETQSFEQVFGEKL